MCWSELAPFSADQQIQRDLHRLFGHSANPYPWRYIHKHCSRHDPCPGSNKLPLQASSQLSAPTGVPISSYQSSLANPAPSSSANPVLPADVSSSQSKAQTPIWSPVGSTVIKRIPKSARHACASHLAILLRIVVSNPDSSSRWQDLFNWSHIILSARWGKGKGKGACIHLI